MKTANSQQDIHPVQGCHSDARRNLPSHAIWRHRYTSGDTSLRCAAFDMTMLFDKGRRFVNKLKQLSESMSLSTFENDNKIE